MDTFGARLKAEREDRGLTIRAVAERLGVEDDRLLALERNDFAALPDEPAMMACLRAYAGCLEVDAELMIEDYAQERERCLRRLAEAVPDRAVEIVPAAAPSYGSRRHGFPRLVPLAVIVAAAVALGAWWMLSGDGAVSQPVRPAAPAAVGDVPAPAASRPVEQPAPPGSSPPAMSVPEHGVGLAVRNRRLVGRSDRFSEGTQVWFWTRVEGGAPGDRIDHVWLENGVEAARIPLKVGGSPWRTYSAKTLRAGSAGSWAVEARDEAGRVLARQEFACVR